MTTESDAAHTLAHLTWQANLVDEARRAQGCTCTEARHEPGCDVRIFPATDTTRRDAELDRRRQAMPDHPDEPCYRDAYNALLPVEAREPVTEQDEQRVARYRRGGWSSEGVRD